MSLTKLSELVPIEVTAGVEPDTDRTSASTVHFTSSKGIRFRNGFPEKIGGWVSVGFDYGETITGKARSIYSRELSNKSTVVIGTHNRLYAYIGSRLTNITPLQTTSTTIADSIETDYQTVSATIKTTNGSNSVELVLPDASRYKATDRIAVSGFATISGIPDTEINATHFIRSISGSSVFFNVTTEATGTATQVQASAVIASGLVRFTSAAHKLVDGERIGVLDANSAGGVSSGAINVEHIIRNVTTDTFDVLSADIAASHVTAAGGPQVKYKQQITAGFTDESLGRGYGMGLYGTGLYGTARLSSNAKRYPRIWYFDHYGDYLIATAGNGTGIYRWDGDTSNAPTLIPNAPTDVNYAFVSDNILVTFGAGGIRNRVFASAQGDIEEWTGSSTNHVFDDQIEGSGRLLSHVPVGGTNLIFSDDHTYKFTYIDRPLVWKIELLDANVGIIAPMARCEVNGIAYWMGKNNFYYWAGANIEVLPSNSKLYSTLLNYIYNNLTSAQRSKIFCWYNARFNEIWWHYPSEASSEPDMIARFNVLERTWCPDLMDRTAAEYPHQISAYPRLIDSNSVMYNHENGHNDDGLPLSWRLTTNKRSSGKGTALITGFVPDSIQTGDISVNIKSWRFPQSTTVAYDTTYSVSPDTEYVSVHNCGRYWQYTISGDALNQKWTAGAWSEIVQKGPNF